MISDVIQDARELAAKARRNVAINDMTDISLDTKVLCEQRMILQMLREVVSNAVKYTPDGKAVTISTKLDGEFAVVEISDKGPGIPEELREAVFQPFFSLENPLQHTTGEYGFKSGGIGLGLTLAKMIASFHKGSINLSNNADGSTVTIRLPISPK
jgi:signal transduction histidine kinase